MSDLIQQALSGERGPDQQRLAKGGLAWVELILQKNIDYGSAAWQEPILCPGMEPRVAIRVRMSDKILRLRNILSTGKIEVKTESIRDTMGDLGTYALLWLLAPEETLAEKVAEAAIQLAEEEDSFFRDEDAHNEREQVNGI